MWDSSYQASRSRTASTGSADADGPAAALAIFTSAMARSQIGFFHALIPGQFGIIALRQYMTAGQHRDDVGEVGDHGKIMLDHQDSMFRRDALDQRADLVDVLVPHARHRLIKQHHLR